MKKLMILLAALMGLAVILPSVVGCCEIRSYASMKGSERLLTISPRPGNARNGEGDLVKLNDGSIYMAYTEWLVDSRGDEAKAHIVERRSADGGKTWSNPREVFPREGVQNDMSVTLLRLADGRLALFNLRKNSDLDCMPLVRFSSDEAKTWSAPVECLPASAKEYYVLNNARVIQTKGGRLIAPLSKHSKSDKEGVGCGALSCVISDDNGKTWRQGREYQVRDDAGKRVTVQEPGVVELKDGKIYMVIRTNRGRQWQAYSKDGGETWNDFGPSPIYGPQAPATIRRAPDGRLLLLWNDHEGHPEYAQKKGDWKGNWGRVPLTLAYSSDEGKTWIDRHVIEPDLNGFYCYIATLFDGDDLLLHYYCSQPGLSSSCVSRISNFIRQ